MWKINKNIGYIYVSVIFRDDCYFVVNTIGHEILFKGKTINDIAKYLKNNNAIEQNYEEEYIPTSGYVTEFKALVSRLDENNNFVRNFEKIKDNTKQAAIPIHIFDKQNKENNTEGFLIGRQMYIAGTNGNLFKLDSRDYYYTLGFDIVYE